MSKLADMFKEPKSMEELEAENEKKGMELSIKKQELLIAELEARKKKWQDFSSNGKKSGINFDRVIAWIQGH
jgi:hypothetical protein